MDSGRRKLHVVMVPWVAMGHLLPFMELSKRLAAKGHRISFLSTPRNIERLLPSIPPRLLTSSSIDLVEISLQRDAVDGKLPDSVEATVDLPSEDVRPYLTAAYNSAFERELSAFLRRNREADWIVYDFPAHWVPSVAAGHGVPCALLCLFGAAAMSFFGTFSGDNGRRPKSLAEVVEKMTAVPDWVPFPTTVAFRRHEARRIISMHKAGAPKDHDPAPWRASIERCQFVAIRSCVELEPEWLKLLGDLYQKPVMPLGLFPPSVGETAQDGIDPFQGKTWAATFEWLDKQATRSVVYAAFGSEVKLSSSQVQAIALGLEQSGLPFVWALRADSAELPEGFDGRTEGQGVVCKGWVPQARFLAHPSVGGFLTHGGWNSVVEGMTNGVVLLLLPLILDQGLNARSLVEKGIGVEVARDEDDDGAFTGDGIARGLKLVMVEAEGERFRAKAAELKEVLGDEEKHNRCVDEFVEYLWDHRRSFPSA